MNDSQKYDERYRVSRIYREHYSKVFYYKVWNCVVDGLVKDDKILELGCGTGQLAQLLYDKGFTNYIGIDFSRVAIEIAKARVPSFTFINDDLNNIDYSNYADFKFVSTETFEHLKNDIELIKKFPKSSIVFSVPNRMAKLHYRKYPSEAFIRDRYKSILNVNNVTALRLGGGKIIFVVEANIL